VIQFSGQADPEGLPIVVRSHTVLVNVTDQDRLKCFLNLNETIDDFRGEIERGVGPQNLAIGTTCVDVQGSRT
jgi:hypothetical protein